MVVVTTGETLDYTNELDDVIESLIDQKLVDDNNVIFLSKKYIKELFNFVKSECNDTTGYNVKYWLTQKLKEDFLLINECIVCYNVLEGLNMSLYRFCKKECKILLCKDCYVKGGSKCPICERSKHNTNSSTTMYSLPVGNAVPGNYNFNLPTTVGTSGQVLTSGGSTSPMTWATSTGATGGPATGPFTIESGPFYINPMIDIEFTLNGVSAPFNTGDVSVSHIPDTITNGELYTISDNIIRYCILPTISDVVLRIRIQNTNSMPVYIFDSNYHFVSELYSLYEEIIFYDRWYSTWNIGSSSPMRPREFVFLRQEESYTLDNRDVPEIEFLVARNTLYTYENDSIIEYCVLPDTESSNADTLEFDITIENRSTNDIWVIEYDSEDIPRVICEIPPLISVAFYCQLNGEYYVRGTRDRIQLQPIVEQLDDQSAESLPFQIVNTVSGQSYLFNNGMAYNKVVLPDCTTITDPTFIVSIRNYTGGNLDVVDYNLCSVSFMYIPPNYYYIMARDASSTLQSSWRVYDYGEM